MDDTLVICLLGEVRLRLGGANLFDSLGHKEAALLIYLTCTHRPQLRETLADLFWDARPKAQGQANLRTLLARLRRALPAHVVVHRDTVSFDVDRSYRLDAAEFQAQTSAAHMPPLLLDGRLSRSAADTLGRALRLYRGDFLAGFHVHEANGFESWAAGERERLRRIALDGLARLADFCLERGQHAAGLEHTTRLLALDPLDEAAHRRMMHLLVLSDQRHTALAQYETCRQALAEELGMEPDSETIALYERIRGGQYARSAVHVNSTTLALPFATRHAALKTHDRSNLPAPLTPLIGREVELARLRGRLLNPDCRLITLAGAGGMGKTRLALAAAIQAWAEFADGIRLVALADVASGERLQPQQARSILANAIADAVGFAAGDLDTATALCDGLRHTELLLLLDSMEHVIGGADLIVELLRGAPNICVLTTSRQPLNLQAEQIVWLRGLPVPPSELDPRALTADSVCLFAERVERLGIELSIAEQLPEILDICRLVAGLPLAIELAATLVAHLPLAKICQLLRDDPGAVTTSAGDLPARQRSLRAVFESSWLLLSAAEQRVLSQCSVFRGSFTLEMAEQSRSAPNLRYETFSANDRAQPPLNPQSSMLNILSALVDKSLLHTLADDRYELDQLWRPFAAEKNV